jgi:hypothetical protein
MVLFLLTTLVFSIVGLGALIGVKQWELNTGRVVLAGHRPHLARTARRIIFWVERVLPALAAYWARRVWRTGLVFLQTTLAKAILTAELWLERTLHFVRHKTSNPPAAQGEASAFLREVAEHKKRLLENKKVE